MEEHVGELQAPLLGGIALSRRVMHRHHTVEHGHHLARRVKAHHAARVPERGMCSLPRLERREPLSAVVAELDDGRRVVAEASEVCLPEQEAVGVLLARGARDLRIRGIANGENLRARWQEPVELLPLTGDQRERHRPSEVMRKGSHVGADAAAPLKLAPGEHHATRAHRRRERRARIARRGAVSRHEVEFTTER